MADSAILVNIVTPLLYHSFAASRGCGGTRDESAVRVENWNSGQFLTVEV
jgi:hypothetical protein